jgi:hypothetical protein
MSSIGFKTGFLIGQGIMAGALCLIISLTVAQNWKKDALLLKYYDKTLKNREQ